MKTERYLIEAAHRLEIRSIAVLDEWYNYKLRFQDENGVIGKYLPNMICLQDELSKKFAMEEGLPETVLRITGSPALAGVYERAKNFVTNPPPIPEMLKKKGDRPVLLFLSEGLSKTHGETPDSKGTYGTYLGFQEKIVRADIAELAGQSGKEILVLEKLHPSEEIRDAPQTGSTIEWHVIPGTENVEPYLWHADILIGMFSKSLLESAVMGQKPISYQPNGKAPNKCTAVRLGFAELCAKKNDLAKSLNEHLSQQIARKKPIALPCANPRSAAMIVSLATA